MKNINSNSIKNHTISRWICVCGVRAKSLLSHWPMAADGGYAKPVTRVFYIEFGQFCLCLDAVFLSSFHEHVFERVFFWFLMDQANHISNISSNSSPNSNFEDKKFDVAFAVILSVAVEFNYLFFTSRMHWLELEMTGFELSP